MLIEREMEKNANTWELNNTLIKNKCVIEEIKIFLESNNNEDMSYYNLRDTTGAGLRG